MYSVLLYRYLKNSIKKIALSAVVIANVSISAFQDNSAIAADLVSTKIEQSLNQIDPGSSTKNQKIADAVYYATAILGSYFPELVEGARRRLELENNSAPEKTSVSGILVKSIQASVLASKFNNSNINKQYALKRKLMLREFAQTMAELHLSWYKAEDDVQARELLVRDWYGETADHAFDMVSGLATSTDGLQKITGKQIPLAVKYYSECFDKTPEQLRADLIAKNEFRAALYAAKPIQSSIVSSLYSYFSKWIKLIYFWR